MNNNLRITGLASGIDTEEMVQNLMRAERVKVDRVEQDRQTLLWRQEIYNDLNKDFANFILNSRKAFGLTSVRYDGTLVPNSYKNLNWVKKGTSSDETIATVSTTGKAMDSNFELEIKELAKSAIIVDDGINEECIRNIKDIKIEVKVGDENREITIDSADSMDDLIKKINTSKVKKDDKDVSSGISAFYDKENRKLFLQTAETGENVEIKLSYEGESSKSTLSQGSSAKVVYNGVELKYSSNRFTINNINIEAKSIGKTSVTIATDVDGIYEKVDQFVKDYNELVDKTNKLLGEKRYRDYKPLTAEQKKGMEKADVDLWEEKAKSGLLRSDDIISRTMLNTRQSIYKEFKTEDGFSGTFKLITEIGISTEQYSRGSAGGKLVIDEQKLKDAIAKNPEDVMELLFKESAPEVVDEKGNPQLGGFVTRIQDNLMSGMEEIIKKSGTGENADLYRGVKGNILLDFVSKHSSISLIDKDVLQYSRKIDDLNEMLFRKENNYYAKFAAMEKAISRMNQQSGWLMQQSMK